MIYIILLSFLLFLIIGRTFLKSHKYYSRIAFVNFVLLNLLILLWFIMQYKFWRETFGVELDVLEYLIPKYILELIKIVSLQVLYNILYVVFHRAKNIP